MNEQEVNNKQLVVEIDPKLHHKLRMKAMAQNMTLREWIIPILERAVKD